MVLYLKFKKSLLFVEISGCKTEIKLQGVFLPDKLEFKGVEWLILKPYAFDYYNI